MSDERIDQLERWREDLERRFAEAFPGGDHVGHCRYHQLMIEGIDAKKRLREAIIQKTIAGLVWGAMIGLGLAVWQYLKSLLKG
jgi:hypothetical protein